MFTDEIDIYVRSGDGGSGMVHFHREKFVPRGGPDGGDGGRGGDVIFRVDPVLNTLSSFHYKDKFLAKNGKNGGPNKMSGRYAETLFIRVPPGTLITDAKSKEILADLVETGQEWTICKGGRGGRGNVHFATARNQAPRTGEKGEPGEERWLHLELKLIADVGIVGMPNAGKSSLLAAVTNAHPKIADYPFTTLEPNLGVAELDMNNSLILADIPGLIEGAHLGIGLGDAFLRHIQRTRVLIHMLDAAAGDPLLDFSQINSELALFDENLGKKPQIVAANKMDLPEAQENWPKLKKQLEKLGYVALPVSTLTREGIKEILWKTYEVLQSAPPVVKEEVMPIYRPAEDPRDFKVSKEEGGWRVSGKAIERAAAMTYWEFEGSVRRFQRIMETIGVDEALRQAGIQEGETVCIGDYELEWQD